MHMCTWLMGRSPLLLQKADKCRPPKPQNWKSPNISVDTSLNHSQNNQNTFPLSYSTIKCFDGSAMSVQLIFEWSIRSKIDECLNVIIFFIFHGVKSDHVNIQTTHTTPNSLPLGWWMREWTLELVLCSGSSSILWYVDLQPHVQFTAPHFGVRFHQEKQQNHSNHTHNQWTTSFH